MKLKMVIFVGILGMVLGWTGLGFCNGVTVSGTTTVFTSIQAGIDACPIDGTVSVAAGTYNEAVYINKRIALVGVGTPTITAAGLGSTNAVTFDGSGADGGLITGFVITGATGDLPNGNGIYCNNASPTITNNTISGNEFGIYCCSSSPTITNNTISGNGDIGIHCSSSSSIITNNTISGNNCEGIYCSSSSPTITNNTISGNGNGIYCYYFSSPTITNNIISGNSYNGISCYSSSPAITNNTISGNSGNGIAYYSSSSTITNNTISGNGGHGILCDNSSSPTITNNTISGNSGQGICCSSSPTITNNIITENGTTSTNYYGIYNPSGNPTINYNCVWKNGLGGNNNYSGCSAGPSDISANPLFISTATGNYHLQSNSPCIDKGSNTAIGIILTDKDGNPRITNAIIDMGAYEYQGAPPQPAQINITPTFGTVGSIITIFGNGFGANEMVRLDFGMRATITTSTTDSGGTFATTFTIDFQPCGSTTIRATGLISGKTADVVFFIMPKIFITPTIGPVGSIVTVVGNGYLASEIIRLDFGKRLSIVSSQSDSAGRFTTCWTTDTQSYGIKTITAYGITSNIYAASTFAIKANIVCLIPTMGTVGCIVTILGNGFDSEENIRVGFGTIQTITMGVSSINGNFTTAFIINTQPFGTKTISISGITSGAYAMSFFFIKSRIILVTPNFGTIGSIITIRGDGFGYYENIRVNFGTTQSIATSDTHQTGSFTVRFTVDTQAYGTTTISALGLETQARAEDTFNILPKSNISVLPTSGTVGSYVTVFGDGFEANEMVKLDFGMRSTIATSITNSGGTFATTFIVDTQSCGSTTIRAIGIFSGKSAEAIFFIMPKILITPTIGMVGSIVTVIGNGYLASEAIRLDFGDIMAIVSSQSDSAGRFTTCFTTDTQPYGTKTVVAYGDISNIYAATTFAMKAKIVMIAPIYGTVGTCVTIVGNGFGSAENIWVSFGTTMTISMGVASICGTFSNAFIVDTQPYGPTTITVRGMNTMAEARASFYIRSCLIMVSPTIGIVGTIVRTMGNGFGATELVRLSFGNVATINITTTNVTGMFDASFIVDTQSAGTKTIMAQGMMTGQVTCIPFRIMPNIILLTPYQGTVGSCVTIAGNGFAEYESLRIDLGSTLNIRSVTSSVDGSFMAAFTINTQPYGITTARVSGITSCLIAQTRFMILPQIILVSPPSGQIGDVVTVAGNGFGAGEMVGIDFGNTATIAIGTVMANGAFQLVFTVDNQPMGTITLRVRGLATNIMDAEIFFILPSVTLKITPLVQNIVKGQEFIAQVEVVNVSQLVTGDIWINFNPNILEAISVGSGTFVANCSSPGYLIGTGTIKYSFGSFGSPTSGSGILCFLQFRAKERGVSSVAIDNQTKLYTVVNDYGVEIPCAKHAATYYIISGLRVQPQDRVIRAGEYVAYQCISDGDSLMNVTGSATFTASGGGDINNNIFHARNMGTYTIMAAYLGLTCTTSVIVVPGTPATLSYVSGNNQANTCTLTLNEPFVVKVEDSYNNPCPNVGINWQVSSAPVGATGYFVAPTMTTTNIQGMASSSLTLGIEPPGTYTISAICSGLSGSPITFTANSLRRFGSISGFCLLRLGMNRYGTCSDIQVTILETGATTTTNNSSYFAFSHVPVGVYSLYFDTWGASCATISPVNISPTQFEDTTNIGTMTLLAGDVGNDGEVDIRDWPLFASAWRNGVTADHSDWLIYREGDFNHSCAVNSPDFIVLRNNFNKAQGLFGGLRAPSLSPVSAGSKPAQSANSSGQIDLSFNLETLEGVDINDLRVGNTIYLKINIKDATNFMAGEVHLSFNPDVLEVIDSLPASEGINIQPGTYPEGEVGKDVYPLINNADNESGKIDYAVATIEPQTNDGGLFAIVLFRIKSYGATAKVGLDENRTTMFVEAPMAVDNKPANLINLPPVEVKMEKQEVVVVVPMRYSNLDNAIVYPNPAVSGQTIITFAQLTDGKKTIKIYSISGELVEEFSSTENPAKWTVPSNFASGIYLYLIDDHAGSIKQGKFGIIK